MHFRPTVRKKPKGTENNEKNEEKKHTNKSDLVQQNFNDAIFVFIQ